MNTAEKQAHKSADMITVLAGELGLLLFSYSPDLKSLISWSDNIKEVLGARDPDVMRDASLFLRHVHVEDRFRVLQELEKALKGESDYDITYRWIRPDSDRTRMLHARARMTQTSDGELFQGLIADVSRAFEYSNSDLIKDYLNLATSELESTIITLDSDLRITAVNKKVQEIIICEPGFNYEKIAIGARFEPSSAPARKEFYDNTLRAVLKGEIAAYNFELSDAQQRLRRDSNYCQEIRIRPLIDGARTKGLAIFVRDISKGHNLQKELLLARRKQALFKLSEGVFHNLRNSFQALLGYSHLLALNPGDSVSVKKFTDLIAETVARAANLIEATPLRELEKDCKDSFAQADLNIAAMEAVSGADEIFKSGISVTVNFGNIPRVRIDQKSLGRLVEELIVALLKTLPGAYALTLRTSAERLKENQIANLALGYYGKLKVNVTAPLDQNKKHGDIQSDLGNGLSEVCEMLNTVGGAISYDLNKLDNASLTLYVPSEDLKKSTRDRSRPNGSARVLLLDDDFVVLDSVSAGLKEKGYSCFAATDLEEAIQILREEKSIEVVIFDNVNPLLTPEETCKILASSSAKAKFIGLSACDSQSKSKKPATHHQFFGQVTKPVNVNSLIEAVERGLAKNV
jgi:CheY-like chemotaxis protein/signal transduction histidine kinase